MSYHHGNLRHALLRRAAEVIAADGVENLSLRALARDLGVSHAAPSRHFADRAALLSALAYESQVEFLGELDAAEEAAGDDPVARYNAIGKALVRFALANPAYYRAMEHPDVRKRAPADLRDANEEYRQRLFAAARAAQAKGWLRDHDVKVAVLFSTAAAQGAARLLTNAAEDGLAADIDPAAIGEEIIDIVIPPHSSRLKGSPE